MTKNNFLRGGRDSRKTGERKKRRHPHGAPAKDAPLLRALKKLDEAETNLKVGFLYKAGTLIQSALAIGEQDPETAPEAYLHAINMLEDHDLYEQAQKITETGLGKHPQNTPLTVKKAWQFIEDGKQQVAIALLRPIHKGDPTNESAAVALARAYLVDKQPDQSIAVLKPFYDANIADEEITYGLANAYVTKRDRSSFEKIKKQLPDDYRADYYDAKLHFFEGSGQKALKLLEPLLSRFLPAQRITSLFMACVGNEHPVHQELQTKFGEEFYAATIKHMKEWRRNPARQELFDNTTLYPGGARGLASSQGLYDYGANPASAGDRDKAGMGARTPVAVKRTDPSPRRS